MMKSIKLKRSISKTCIYLILIVGALGCLYPFVWMLSGALKLDNDLYVWPVEWIPKVVHWENITSVLDAIPFFRYFGNTLKLAVIITLLQVVTSSLAAYSFSKINYPGRDKVFLMYLATMMIPFQVIMIPQYIMMGRLGLQNSHWALILIQSFSPFGVFLLRQAFVSIPNELSESARIDGCKEMRILAQIILPLSKANIATLIIFTFTGVWNDYLAPLIYLNRDSLRTIQVGLRAFSTTNGIQYTLILCATAMSLLPIIIVYICGQRYFIESAATSGLKG